MFLQQWINVYLALFFIPTISSLTVDIKDLMRPKPNPTPFQDWDYIMFSQRWPVTACVEWQEKSKNNICVLPNDSTTWIVHGLWPTKIGAQGPYFCNSALHFDMSQIQPILDDLEQFWTNVEANTKLNSFWKHEWDKHGTCAATLPQLNSVTNFFKRGLLWNQQFKLSEILMKGAILPDSNGYTVEDVFEVVRNTIGKNPIVECIVDGASKQSFLSEIRICFDKNLDLIHCNVTKPNASIMDTDDNVLSNCNLKKPVMYYSKVPNATVFYQNFDRFDDDIYIECRENLRRQDVLVNVFNFLKFLIWFTL